MATISTGEITFEYNSNELFNEVGILSAYMAKSVSSEAASLDDFSISDDEKEVYDVCVKQTLPNIYEVLLKMTSKAGGDFKSDNSKISFSIDDNKAYNENVLTLVEDTIRECLKYGILAEFYSINANTVLHATAQSKFASNLTLLSQRLFQLKRKKINSLS